ncbi:condensin complex subunit 2/barren [Gongronella butleri]|nr:condensin complex subunit 2/barren [Gongronella butleri]
MTRPMPDSPRRDTQDRGSRKRSRQDRRSDGQGDRLRRSLLSRQALASNHPANTSSDSNNQTLIPLEVNALPTVSPEQMYSNFEEWLKMATDNKINATNSWNFALIDYFHEMAFIREGDSINFQRASCTLDGCVKIYTSRVDSVASETGKLLTGLSDHAGNDTDDGDQEQEKRTRRRATRSEKTLLKDFSQIANKKLEVDFSVDPLFKKTSADFDEGGARGLLLNVLSLDHDGKIIFDSSDAPPEQIEDMPGTVTAIDTDATADDTGASDHDEDDTPEMDNAMDIDTQMPSIAELELGSQLIMFDDPGQHALAHESVMDITKLRSKLRLDMDFDTLTVCPTLKTIDFFGDGADMIDDLNQVSKEKDPDELEQQEHAPHDGAASVAPPMDDPYDGFDFDFGDDDDMAAGGGEFADPFAEVNDDALVQDPNGDPLDGDDLDQHDQQQQQQQDDERPDEGIYSITSAAHAELLAYFDTTMSKAWAGPEHWKLRRTTRQTAAQAPTPISAATPSDSATPSDAPTPAPERPTRKRAAQDKNTAIDFLHGEDIKDEDIFGRNKRTDITLPLSRQHMDPASLLLPDDQQFSSKQLLRFFLKPKIKVLRPNFKKRAPAVNERVNELQPTGDIIDDDGFDMEGMDDDAPQFWANQEAMPEDLGPADTTQLDDPLNDAASFGGYDDTFPETSMFDDDPMGMYDADDAQVYDDPLVGSQVKKVKPPYVDYAKKAKRVDVKKLKENLWKALTVPPPGQPLAEEPSVYGELKFMEVIHHLKTMYPPKVMRDISVPFCFICLLHLANEKNLSISGLHPPGQDNDELFVLGDDTNWLNSDEVLQQITIVQN